MIAIAKNPSFGNIRKLNFYRTGITIKAIKVLARSKVLKKVKHLNIGRNYLHPDSAKALADTSTCAAAVLMAADKTAANNTPPNKGINK